MSNTRHLRVAIDIGTTKTTVLVGIFEESKIRILGFGEVYQQGILRDGNVSNIGLAVEAITQAIRQASLDTDLQIDNVAVGCSGTHLSFRNNDGRTSVRSPDEVRQSDLDRAIASAREISLPMDFEILHDLPQQFLCDGNSVNNPVDMAAVTRLDVKVHLITAEKIHIKNLHRCIEKNKLNISCTVASPLASLFAVTSSYERSDGWVVVIDIGAGVCDVSVIRAGSVDYTGVISFGGEYITRIIANEFKVAIDEAERIKKEYGCAFASLVDEEDYFSMNLPNGHSKNISRFDLAIVIEKLYRNIFERIKDNFDKQQLFQDVGATAVVRLTGGASQVEGCTDLAEDIFKIAAAVAHPTDLFDKGNRDLVDDPSHSTVVGILKFALLNSKVKKETTLEKIVTTSGGLKPITEVLAVPSNFKNNVRSLWQWFKDTW